jgi:hypothetical protein
LIGIIIDIEWKGCFYCVHWIGEIFIILVGGMEVGDWLHGTEDLMDCIFSKMGSFAFKSLKEGR